MFNTVTTKTVQISFIIAIATTAIISVLSQSTPTELCANPLFMNPSEYGADTNGPFNSKVLQLPGMDKPQAYPASDGGTCAYFVGNPSTCCSPDTLQAIIKAFTDAEQVIKTAEAEISKDKNPVSNAVMTSVESVGKIICEAGSKIIPGLEEKCKQYTDTVAKYSKIFTQDSYDIVEAQTKCAEAVTAYAEGLVCFACTVNFKDYVDLEKKVIKISTRTCDGIYDQCETAVQKTVVQLLQHIQDFVEEIIKIFAGTSAKGFPKVSEFPDMCGGTVSKPGDCKAFVCDIMLDGFVTSQWLNWDRLKPSSSVLHTNRRLIAESKTAGKKLKTENDVAEFVHFHLTTQHRHLAEHITNEYTKLSASTSHNEYTASGFDAYTVGCANSGVHCGGLPTWAVVCALVGGAMIIIATAFIAVKRCKNKQSGRNGASLLGGNGATSSAYSAI